MLITKNGRPTAVIISADEWEAIEDTAFWRSVPDIANDITEARTVCSSAPFEVGGVNLVLDAGALIAIERNDRRVAALIER